MKKITIDYFTNNIKEYLTNAENWDIFLYPTDTVYWIWAIPSIKSVEKIYEIKQRDLSKPVSIIAPSIDWIEENFITPENFNKIFINSLEKYHWTTFLLERKNPSFLRYVSNNNKIWIRILRHSFQQFIYELWQPFITTSANLSWEPSADKINLISEKVKNKVNIIIDWWKLHWIPSVIIDPFEGSEKHRNK